MKNHNINNRIIIEIKNKNIKRDLDTYACCSIFCGAAPLSNN